MNRHRRFRIRRNPAVGASIVAGVGVALLVGPLADSRAQSDNRVAHPNGESALSAPALASSNQSPVQSTTETAKIARDVNSDSTVSPQAVLCHFETHGDWVHISGTLPRAASAHGWWNNIDCKATKADVTVQLQIEMDGKWKNVGEPGKATVLPGGGGGKRATARVNCVNQDQNMWRSWVDVDLVGVIDDTYKYYPDPKPLACTPSASDLR